MRTASGLQCQWARAQSESSVWLLWTGARAQPVRLRPNSEAVLGWHINHKCALHFHTVRVSKTQPEDPDTGRILCPFQSEYIYIFGLRLQFLSEIRVGRKPRIIRDSEEYPRGVTSPGKTKIWQLLIFAAAHFHNLSRKRSCIPSQKP